MSDEARPVLTRDAAHAAELARTLAADGWRVQQGWALPTAPWDVAPDRIALHGTIRDSRDAGAAVLAAARGARIVAVLEAPQPLVDDLLDDLGRLGDIDDRSTQPDDGLDHEQRRLLGLLGDGASTKDAASQLHISLRTAERRLSAARAALGVRTTAEAVRRARPQSTP